MDNNETAVATIEAPPSTPPIIQTKDGKLFRHINVDGFNGFAEHRVPPPAYPSGEPYIDWVGPKFSLAQWHRILAFFEWSYQEHKSEAQVRLYVNLHTRETMVWAFPQRCVGMTTQELGDHFTWPENEAMVRGFDKVGTVHHHCSGSAFQSGTDRSDEAQSNGLHITVGGIGKDTYDLHTRVILNGNSQEADLTQWFEMPPELENLPEMILCFRDSIFLGLLRRPPPPAATFPEMWKDNVKTYGVVQHSGTAWSPGRGPYSGPAYPPTGKVATSGPGHTPGHPINCYCIACMPNWKGRHDPFPKSASSNGTPGPGAGAKISGDVTARVGKALKKVTVASPNALEEAFMDEMLDTIKHYNLTRDRALELVCLLLVDDDRYDTKVQAEMEDEFLAQQAELRDLNERDAKEAVRMAYGEEAADQLYGTD